jgi:hypothetical protein
MDTCLSDVFLFFWRWKSNSLVCNWWCQKSSLDYWFKPCSWILAYPICRFFSSDGENLRSFVALCIQAIAAIREIIVYLFVFVCNCYWVTSVAKRCSFRGKLMNENRVLVELCLPATAEVHGGKHVSWPIFQLHVSLASVVRRRRLAAQPILQGCCS